jgi:hypothetical protein
LFGKPGLKTSCVKASAHRAVIPRYPKRNIALRDSADVIKRYDGEPRPEPSRDPSARRWSVHFIGGKRMERLGTVEAVDAAGAVDVAATLFGLDNLRRSGWRFDHWESDRGRS